MCVKEHDNRHLEWVGNQRHGLFEDKFVFRVIRPNHSAIGPDKAAAFSVTQPEEAMLSLKKRATELKASFAGWSYELLL